MTASKSRHVEARGAQLGRCTGCLGPILALTSWTRLLSPLELEMLNDPAARGDLRQLQALCEAADVDAFVPFASEDLTDQRIPAFVLQVNGIVQASVDLGVTEGLLTVGRLNPGVSRERIGRYAQFTGERGPGSGSASTSNSGRGTAERRSGWCLPERTGGARRRPGLCWSVGQHDRVHSRRSRRANCRWPSRCLVERTRTSQ